MMEAPYSPREESLNVITHAAGVVLALIGGFALVIQAAAKQDLWLVASVLIFAFTMVLLYGASTLYHSVSDLKLKRRLKVLDHTCIYLLIAGTYTPFLLVNMRGPTGWTLFAIVWSLALAGIACKLAWPHRFTVLRVAIYLIMGWLIVFASGEMSASLSTSGIVLLAAGGITYTLGVIFFAISAIPYNHAIWHLFVLGGSTCHYFAVYAAVLPHGI